MELSDITRSTFVDHDVRRKLEYQRIVPQGRIRYTRQTTSTIPRLIQFWIVDIRRESSYTQRSKTNDHAGRVAWLVLTRAGRIHRARRQHSGMSGYFERLWHCSGTVRTFGPIRAQEASPTTYHLRGANRCNRSVQRCVLMTTDPGDLVLDPNLRFWHDSLRC